MLEGILIEDLEQISEIARLCEYVYVDRTVSVGHSFTVAPKSVISPKAIDPELSFFELFDKFDGENQKVKSNQVHLSYEHIKPIIADKKDKPITIHPANEANKKFPLTTTINNYFSKMISGFSNTAYMKEDAKSTVSEKARPVEYEIVKIYPVYAQTQIATREIFEALALSKEVDLSKINVALDSMVDSIERNPDALIWLAKLKKSDDIAYNHSLNVSITLMALSSFLSLPKKQVKELGLAGLLQDIGKSKIPLEILHKPEKVSTKEFDVLKKHVEYSMELLDITCSIPTTVTLTISQHHERIDGSGYPKQLTGNNISLTGQMAGLVDTYCALTTNRVYAKGVYNQAALEEIHTLRDSKFNGVLIDQLVQFLGVYPVSTLVELNSGEVGVVIQQNTVRRLLPRVMILLNPDKTKSELHATIDLIDVPRTADNQVYQIVRGLPPDSYGLSANNYYG